MAVQGSSSEKIGFLRWETPAELQSGTFANVKLADQTRGGLVLTDGAEAVAAVTEPGDTQAVFTGRHYFGAYTSPVVATKSRFNWAVASWEADTPPGTWIRVELRATAGERQTGWYTMGIWASDSSTIKRQSVKAQRDVDGRVADDTLILRDDINACALQYRVTLYTSDLAVTPRVRSVSVVTCDRLAENRVMSPDRSVWGTELAVPERSQMDYRDIGGRGWCSPTSTSMVMAYWADKIGRPDLIQTVPDMAHACYDEVFGGTGNWPFNTAAAAAYGLCGTITRFESAAQLEQWIKVGVPIIIGVAFKDGQLTGAPVPSTNGHLILVRGFDAQGNVICNDPAAELWNGQVVRVVYDRAELEKVWLGANAVAYLIYPDGHPVPANPHGAWIVPE